MNPPKFGDSCPFDVEDFLKLLTFSDNKEVFTDEVEGIQLFLSVITIRDCNIGAKVQYRYSGFLDLNTGKPVVEIVEKERKRSLHAEIVEVEIEVVSPSFVPSGNFAELKSYCHLYGAQGQRQAYLLPMPR
ncbi:hypothetical protein TNCV_4739111 [Trichonephila clavipes]|nr:hypothetical protein TNCV_4739111 [Trichonephila clavipes]